MAWKIRIDDVGSPAWHELRRQRDICALVDFGHRPASQASRVLL
jgi:hypothetical protein